jgi:FtsH-binding integral membrane protein
MKYFISYAIAGCLGFLLLSVFLAEIVRILPAIPIPAMFFFWGIVFVILSILAITTGTISLWEKPIFLAIGLVVLGGFLGYFV